MDAKTKKYLLIGTIATVVLSGAGYGAYRYFKKKGYTTSSSKQKEKEEEKLLTKTVSYGAEGYANVRSSPKVDNENWGRFDFSHNLIKKVNTNPVGSILERVKGEDGYYWYKISLTVPVNGKNEGYVREDAVIIDE
ncbi:MAG: hypothetical protein CMD31_13050 [Flavobacteriales bacterium]|jgi:hypothetical protein|nr:hypothetical protein [Flavobacteriales bacterium]|tara:strand:- start:33542 stop:33949 length:408 start_codon:yes stop_codon:yes gene_type:complete